MTEPATTTSQDLLRFVERFAMLLEDAGMSRMPARIFAYVLAEDSDRYTAAELAEGMGVSRAAVSGAVRTLVEAGLLSKERVPGGRADLYLVHDEDVWAAINEERIPVLYRFADVVADGVELVGRDTRGGRRLRQSQAFFLFMARELPKLIEEWHRQKDDLTDQVDRRD